MGPRPSNLAACAERRARRGAWLALGMGLLGPAEARAQATAEACVEAHVRVQRMRARGELTQARREAVTCAASGCPELVRGDCAPWLSEIDRETPTVVVSAVDANRRDVSDGRLLVDGIEISARLDGKPVPVNPGGHVVRVVRPDEAAGETHIVAQTGVKNRLVALTLAPPPAGAASSAGARGWQVPTSAWVSGSIAAAALVSFAAFALAGQVQYSQLRADCAPACARSDADRTRRKFLIADVSLAAAVVASGVTVFLIWSADAAPGVAQRPAGLGLGGSF